MNLVKKVLMFVGLVVLAAALVSVLAPKATHALVATLVQVANTPASPVPNRDVDDPDRGSILYGGCTAAPSAGSTQSNCVANDLIVGEGQRFVSQQLEAYCTAPKGNNVYGTSVSVFEAGNYSAHFFPLISEGDAAGQVAFGQNLQVHYYNDCCAVLIGFGMNTTDTSGNTSCTFAVSGYSIALQ